VAFRRRTSKSLADASGDDSYGSFRPVYHTGRQRLQLQNASTRCANFGDGFTNEANVFGLTRDFNSGTVIIATVFDDVIFNDHISLSDHVPRIINENNTRLPVMPTGLEYQYDVENHELVVIRSTDVKLP